MHISGLHHVTAIASDPQRNLDFYTGLLGVRLVKRTINFDDPGSYHFYFGDGLGSPGTALTFFPWPHARRGRRGAGEVAATAYAIPAGSLDYWRDRLREHGATIDDRFNETVLRVSDPDGMAIELIASASPPATQPWADSPVPPDHALRGFHSVSAELDDIEPTARLLTEVFGYRLAGESGHRSRFVAQGAGDQPGRIIDLVRIANSSRPQLGAGSVHHVALRAPDAAEQLAWRERIARLGYGVSPVMDRTYFESIYFREPGGILFEIATDGPGFAVDESPAELGAGLRLPPWLENSRDRIEEILPPIHLPVSAR